MYIILILLAATAAALLWALIRVRNAHQRVVADNEALKSRFRSVVDADAEAEKVLKDAGIEATRLRRDADSEATRVQASANAHASQVLADAFRRESSARAAAIAEEERMSAVQLEAAAIEAELTRLRAELAPLDEEANLQTFGFYKPHYSFDTSDAYKREEERVHASQASLIKAGRGSSAKFSVVSLLAR